ncbi:porimin [Ochotona curzoniae]|uniref:porimin n=1 Tax=Ochotona curzoniae TaxID=130825 RepID=UPI001B34F468|nr:porimin [Ochotona curzoniae]
MGRGPRGAWAVLLLGALQVLLGAAVGSNDTAVGNQDPGLLVAQRNSTANSTVLTTVPSGSANISNSTVKPVTPAASAPSNVTATTVKPVTSKMAPTPGVSNMTSTTLKSTTKASASRNTSQMPTSTVTTTHNSTVTTISTTATMTATIHSEESRASKFDTGSFVGGIVLTLGVLSILYIGCKMYYSRRGIRYRTIDEHDAII